ncbi:MAG: hypothetical protein NTX53_20110 [candidate division WOR-3 bacterium]|nr:hypothetical protein [candidate division WOR-3 bacterium]
MPRHSLVGQKLQNGTYGVVESVGSGGMSDVYRGVDTLLKRKVQGKRNVPMAAVIGPALVLVLAAILCAMVECGVGFEPRDRPIACVHKEEK